MIKRFRKTALGGILTAILSFSIVGQFTVGTALLTVPTAAAVITTVACTKDQLAASAQDVLDLINNPQVQAAIPANLLTQWRSLEPSARALIVAIKAGDFTTALSSVNAIFPVIDIVAAALHANPGVLKLIAVGNIALHFIINHMKKQLTSLVGITPEMQTALDYAAQPAWGCGYHKKDSRCR